MAANRGRFGRNRDEPDDRKGRGRKKDPTEEQSAALLGEIAAGFYGGDPAQKAPEMLALPAAPPAPLPPPPFPGRTTKYEESAVDGELYEDAEWDDADWEDEASYAIDDSDLLSFSDGSATASDAGDETEETSFRDSEMVAIEIASMPQPVYDIAAYNADDERYGAHNGAEFDDSVLAVVADIDTIADLAVPGESDETLDEEDSRSFESKSPAEFNDDFASLWANTDDVEEDQLTSELLRESSLNDFADVLDSVVLTEPPEADPASNTSKNERLLDSGLPPVHVTAFGESGLSIDEALGRAASTLSARVEVSPESSHISKAFGFDRSKPLADDDNSTEFADEPRYELPGQFAAADFFRAEPASATSQAGLHFDDLDDHDDYPLVAAAGEGFDFPAHTLDEFRSDDPSLAPFNFATVRPKATTFNFDAYTTPRATLESDEYDGPEFSTDFEPESFEEYTQRTAISKGSPVAAQESEHITRLKRGLELVITDEQLWRLSGRAIAAVMPTTMTELLTVDPVDGKLKRSVATGPDPSATGCDVDHAKACPSMRLDRVMRFENSEFLDACPYLQRAGEPISAVCIPFKTDKTITGVLHSVASVDKPVPQQGVDDLSAAVTLIGARSHEISTSEDGDSSARPHPYIEIATTPLPVKETHEATETSVGSEESGVQQPAPGEPIAPLVIVDSAATLTAATNKTIDTYTAEEAGDEAATTGYEDAHEAPEFEVDSRCSDYIETGDLGPGPEAIELRIGELVKSSGSFALALVHLDRFRIYNRSHGVAIGDEAVRHFYRVSRQVVRPQDVVTGDGGDEFFLLFPEATANEAATICDRIREDLAASFPNYALPAFTVSIGVADTDDGTTFDELLTIIEGAVVHAEASGHDLTVTASAVGRRQEQTIRSPK